MLDDGGKTRAAADGGGSVNFGFVMAVHFSF